MPIAPIIIQRRLREAGRIRLGEKKTSQGGKSYPAKLGTFRLTSQDQEAIKTAAELFGGTPRVWADAPGDGTQWEVTTTTAELEVIIPPGESGFSQWLELWSAAGAQRRCDGITEVIGDRPCVCDPDNRECSFHTRLSVILPDLPGLGVWRLDTQGYYAAQELAGAVDVFQRYLMAGEPLPGRLRLEQRQAKREVNGKVTTLKYAVPVLDVNLSIRALTVPGRVLSEIIDPATGEITSGNGNGWKPVPVEALPAGPRPSIAEQASAVDTPAPPTPRKNAQEPIPSTGMKPRPASAVVEIEGAAGDSLLDPAVPSEPETVTERGNDQLIAIAAREAGLDDGGRHAFLHAFSGGRYASSKDVPTSEVNDVRAELVRVKRGESTVWPSQPTLEPAPAVLDVPLGEANVEPWTRDRWMKLLSEVPGIGQAKAMHYAMETARTLGLPSPTTLDEHIAPAIARPLRSWLEEQKS